MIILVISRVGLFKLLTLFVVGSTVPKNYVLLILKQSKTIPKNRRRSEEEGLPTFFGHI